MGPETEQCYRVAFDSAPVGIILFDRHGLIADCNQKFIEFAGLPRNEIIGFNLVDPLRDEKVRSAVGAALAGRAGCYESCYLPVLGPVKRRIRARYEALKPGDGELLGGIGVFDDLTGQLKGEDEIGRHLEILVAEQTSELRKTNQLLQLEMSDRKRASQALEIAVQKLQDIIEFLPDATLVIDRNKKVIAWNRAIEAMTGVGKDKMLGKGEYEYAVPFYGKKRPLLIDMVMDASIGNVGWYPFLERDGNVIRAETFVSRMNEGKGATLWGTASLLFDKNRNVIGAIESIRDISERKRAEQEVKLSEERFRAIFESARECIYLKDRSFRYVAVNPAMGKLFETPPSEFIGQTARWLYGEEAGKRAEEYDAGVFNGEIVEKESTRPVLGQLKTFHIIKVPIRDTSGEIIGLCGIARDTTERKQMEINLQNALEFLQTLMDTIPAPIFYKDAQGVYLGCNKAFESCIGLRREDIIGKNISEILSDSSAVREHLEMDAALFRKRGVQVYEYKVTCADGAKRDVIFYKSTFSGNSGMPGGLVGVIIDISERKKAEEGLRESENRFRLVAESIQDVFWMGTPGFDSISYINPAYEDIWGRSRQSLYDAPQSFLESIHPEDKEHVLARMGLLGDTEATFDAEYRILRPDGAIRWVRNRACPIRDTKGRLQLVTGVARDITERKEAEEALRQSEGELRFLSTRLLAVHEEERKLLAGELHDGLGSSMAAIKFCLEKSLEKLKQGETDIFSFEECIALLRITMDDIRRIIIDLRPTMLDDLGLTATVEWFCRKFGDIHPRICVDIRMGVKEEEIPEPLKIVIFRLVQEAFHNIAKYSRARNAKLSIMRKRGAIELAIEDNGEGFDIPSALARVCSQKGLGLTSMKERTELSGGCFSIKSTIGKGTSIRATWPSRRGEKRLPELGGPRCIQDTNPH